MTLPWRRTAGETRTVLVVAMPNSVHTARWLNMVRASDLRFVLLPVYAAEVSAVLERWAPVRSAADVAALPAGHVGVFDTGIVDPAAAAATNAAIGYETWCPSFLSAAAVRFTQPEHVALAVRLLRPTLLHSMEVQLAGYLCLGARAWLGAEFPPWLLSNWGSDIFLYRKLPEHRPRLLAIAGAIDAYLAECRRDVATVRQLGFRGVVLPPTPASGGIDFSAVPALADLDPPSRRREILVKGYHGWSGRGLHILGALARAAPRLQGYRIRVTLAGPEMRRMAADLERATGLEVVLDGYLPEHGDAVARLGRARMTLGLGISDGISTTLLEAMCMGSYPIQADTSCGLEWIRQGETGAMVDPHDLGALTRAIVRAAEDDALVDRAAAVNRAEVEVRWDASRNGQAMTEHYRALTGGLLSAEAART